MISCDAVCDFVVVVMLSCGVVEDCNVVIISINVVGTFFVVDLLPWDFVGKFVTVVDPFSSVVELPVVFVVMLV